MRKYVQSLAAPVLMAIASRKSVAFATVLGAIALIGVIDYVTGVEYRVYPLYFLPLSVSAWYLGRRATLAGATVCAFVWLGSNYLAGLHYSQPSIWVFNFLTQGTSFVVVGLLIATVRHSLVREAELSRTDQLTSLLNRRAFYEAAQHVLVIAARYGHPVTIAYIDIDDFKAVNDTLGHERGDTALRDAAELLRQCIRRGDVAARLGGDEFAVLLPETGADGAFALLERLRARLADALGRIPHPITVTVGAASFAVPPDDVEELVRVADETMYAAKSDGKNRVRLRTIERTG